jgi:plastocyanin
MTYKNFLFTLVMAGPALSCSSTNMASAMSKSKPVAATVLIQHFDYEPKNITIKRGSTVTFTNKDSAPHTVTPQEDAQFTDSGFLKQGQSKTIKFNFAGDQKYYCTIHPMMKGLVKVVD